MGFRGGPDSLACHSKRNEFAVPARFKMNAGAAPSMAVPGVKFPESPVRNTDCGRRTRCGSMFALDAKLQLAICEDAPQQCSG